MAAEQSTRASRAGVRRRRGGRARPKKTPGGSPLPEVLDNLLPGILNEMDAASSILEVLCQAMEAGIEEQPPSLNPFAITLQAGLQRWHDAREKLDLALKDGRIVPARRRS